MTDAACPSCAALRQHLAQAQQELARWKICGNCGEPLEGPGHCSQAVTENEKGLELMHTQALDQRDAILEQAIEAVRRLAQERYEACGNSADFVFVRALEALRPEAARDTRTPEKSDA